MEKLYFLSFCPPLQGKKVSWSVRNVSWERVGQKGFTGPVPQIRVKRGQTPKQNKCGYFFTLKLGFLYHFS